MELNWYLASMVGLGFIYVILWYVMINNWMPSEYLTPIGAILGLCALVLTAIFFVSQIKENI